MNEAIQKAVEVAGGARQLADALGLHRQTVYHWLKTGDIPAKRAVEVENLTGVSRHELRPDIFGLPKKNNPVAVEAAA